MICARAMISVHAQMTVSAQHADAALDLEQAVGLLQQGHAIGNRLIQLSAGRQHDAQMRMALLERAQQVEAALPRQPDVGEHDVDRSFAGQQVEALLRAGCLEHEASRLAQIARGGCANENLILDDHDGSAAGGRFHGSYTLPGSRFGRLTPLRSIGNGPSMFQVYGWPALSAALSPVFSFRAPALPHVERITALPPGC